MSDEFYEVKNIEDNWTLIETNKSEQKEANEKLNKDISLNTEQKNKSTSASLNIEMPKIIKAEEVNQQNLRPYDLEAGENYIEFSKEGAMFQEGDSAKMRKIRNAIKAYYADGSNKEEALKNIIKACDSYTRFKFTLLKKGRGLERLEQVKELREEANLKLERLNEKQEQEKYIYTERRAMVETYGYSIPKMASSKILGAMRFVIENPIRLILKGLVLPVWAINEGVRGIQKLSGKQMNRHISFPGLHSFKHYQHELYRLFNGHLNSYEEANGFLTNYKGKYIYDQDILDRMQADMDMIGEDGADYDYKVDGATQEGASKYKPAYDEEDEEDEEVKSDETKSKEKIEENSEENLEEDIEIIQKEEIVEEQQKAEEEEQKVQEEVQKVQEEVQKVQEEQKVQPKVQEEEQKEEQKEQKVQEEQINHQKSAENKKADNTRVIENPYKTVIEEERQLFSKPLEEVFEGAEDVEVLFNSLVTYSLADSSEINIITERAKDVKKLTSSELMKYRKMIINYWGDEYGWIVPHLNSPAAEENWNKERRIPEIRENLPSETIRNLVLGLEEAANRLNVHMRRENNIDKYSYDLKSNAKSTKSKEPFKGYKYEAQDRSYDCWSVAGAALINYNGGNVTQKNLRQYVPKFRDQKEDETEEQYANYKYEVEQFTTKNKSEDGNLSNQGNIFSLADYFKQTLGDDIALKHVSLNLAKCVKDDAVNADNNGLHNTTMVFKSKIREALAKKQPMAILTGDHYRVIVAADANKITLANSLNGGSMQVSSYDEIIQKNLNGVIELTWVERPTKEEYSGILKNYKNLGLDKDGNISKTAKDIPDDADKAAIHDGVVALIDHEQAGLDDVKAYYNEEVYLPNKKWG